MSLIPDDHKDRFHQYACENRGAKIFERDEQLCGLEIETIRSFTDLHRDVPAIRSNLSGDILSIIPGIELSSDLNAFAAKKSGYHYIGFTEALSRKVEHIANLTFKQSFVYRGEYGRQQRLEKILEIAKPFHLSEAFINSPDKITGLPDNLGRRRLALFVSRIMMRFVIFHEFAHCYLGHLDFLVMEEELASGLLDEMHLTTRAGKNAGISFAERNYLEQEADTWALTQCLRIEMQGHCSFWPFSSKFSAHQRIELVIFSVYLIVWLLAEKARDQNFVGPATHPIPRMRLRYLYQWVMAALTSVNPEYAGLNHSAMAQLRSMELKLQSGWMDEEISDDTQLNNEQRVIFYDRLSKYRYSYYA